MKVILKSDVPNLGRAGDIKEVKNGYARNFLLPRNLVMPANAKSTKEQAFLEKVRERKILKRKKTAEETAATLNGKAVSITMKVGEGKLFGSVTSIHIAKALEEDGFVIDKRSIQLDEPIKNLGHYEINIKFYEGISCDIKLTVQDEEGNTEPLVEEVEEEKPVEDSEADTATEDSSDQTSQEEAEKAAE